MLDNLPTKVLLQKNETGLTLIISGNINERLDLQSSANLPGIRLEFDVWWVFVAVKLFALCAKN